MQISFPKTTNNAPIVIVDNFFSVKELNEIKKEIASLYEVAKLKIFCNNGVDKESNGQAKQHSLSLFVDQVFQNNRDNSVLLKTNRKLFTSSKLRQELIKNNIFYTQLFECNSDYTLLNFYTSGGCYKDHKDRTCFTALTFFELESFSGGNLTFKDCNLSVSSNENRMVIFPGFLTHAAQEINSGLRVSMAQFINYC